MPHFQMLTSPAFITSNLKNKRSQISWTDYSRMAERHAHRQLVSHQEGKRQPNQKQAHNVSETSPHVCIYACLQPNQKQAHAEYEIVSEN